jgi:hypothetical protein
MQSHFILIGQGVFRIAEPAEAIGQNCWSMVAPEHHPANDPITLTPFHSLSPPSQTDTNACRTKVLSSPMAQGLVTMAASCEQSFGLRGYYKDHP